MACTASRQSVKRMLWPADKLIAVGVVDVLPRCLSSAYLFWDPDLAWLGLGKLTALKEIAWVQAASVPRPSLQWYHMVGLPDAQKQPALMIMKSGKSSSICSQRVRLNTVRHSMSAQCFLFRQPCYLCLRHGTHMSAMGL